METKKVVEDLLLSSENEDWMRRVLISSHVISNKFLDLYETGNRSYFRGEEYNFLEFSKGTFRAPDVITVVDRIVSVYVLGSSGQRNSKKVLQILGHNSYIRSYTKNQIRKEILSRKNEFSFLQDSEFKIFYFPFSEKSNESPNNYFFYMFREISKNRFLINSLSNNLNSENNNIRDNMSRRNVVDIILDGCYLQESSN